MKMKKKKKRHDVCRLYRSHILKQPAGILINCAPDWAPMGIKKNILSGLRFECTF